MLCHCSQGNVKIFDMLFIQTEEQMILKIGKQYGSDKSAQDQSMVRKAILDSDDEYGNTLLHLAALNDKKDMYDRLIFMGADQDLTNHDGLTPFTLCARYGIWAMFNHIWEKHLTKVVWKFGNVEKLEVNLSSFDKKGSGFFPAWVDIGTIRMALLDTYISISASGTIEINDMRKKDRVDMLIRARKEEVRLEDIVKEYKKIFEFEFSKKGSLAKKSLSAGMSAIGLITRYRPNQWYEMTKDKIEEAILYKWAQGYNLVHLGSVLIPYCIVLLIFGLMWYYRQLNVLQHSFWWADDDAISIITASNQYGSTVRNPVSANISELIFALNSSVYGSYPSSLGLLPDQINDIESACGWNAIRYSKSGALQACLVLYGVPCLLRLAYLQRRIGPTDLDESEDMKISYDEFVNFIYFNLESLIHMVMCALLMVISISRIMAGDVCLTWYVEMERDATAIAALFLFLNLFIVCKPYKGIGLLVLTIYKFLVSDIFTFLVMYSIFFAAFLLALQTLHNANHVFLAWMDETSEVIRQVMLLTQNTTTLVNANINSNANLLQQSYMMLDGCYTEKRTFANTAFSLLEISFGDGLADALNQARTRDYECAGFNVDGLVIYILIFWVFLTNVLVLNMLIAIMNNTFSYQTKQVHCVWLLDVSYRIMRFERDFPELTDRMQIPFAKHSFWSFSYWECRFWDICLTMYCVPEIRLWGFSYAIFKRFSAVKEILVTQSARPKWKSYVDSLVQKVMKQLKNEQKYPTYGCRQQLKELKLDSLKDKIVEFTNSSFVARDVDACHDIQTEDQGHQLLLISMIYQLDLIEQNLGASHITAKIRHQMTRSGRECIQTI